MPGPLATIPVENLLKRTFSLKPLQFALRRLAPRPVEMTAETLEGFKNAQELALKGARSVAALIEPGWTELQTATLLNTWLADHGVHSFFHYAFVWFGERTRFSGINIKNYQEFSPTARRILPNEPFILDVAPIYRGYMCDIGYSGILGQDEKFSKAMNFLRTLRQEIPKMVLPNQAAPAIWDAVHDRIKAAGYDNIHQLYPFGVLGHRVYDGLLHSDKKVGILNFGWQSYTSILRRGILNELLNADLQVSLPGLWAIEPHIGAEDFGAKFEEILLINENHEARWLTEEGQITGEP